MNEREREREKEHLKRTINEDLSILQFSSINSLVLSLFLFFSFYLKYFNSTEDEKEIMIDDCCWTQQQLKYDMNESSSIEIESLIKEKKRRRERRK